MELASKYNPADVEGKWYQYWLDHHLFSSKPDGREPYTIVIPPPNVTGVLHMGHMLNNTIQDILVRRARMEGKNACWVPGTDHASIATEAKVVNKLAQQGIKKTDLTRDEFLKHAWDWTHEHGGIILKQLRRLGASCDWDRTAFTMDEDRSKSVIKVFVDLYNKGLIYRGVRMVNWDPKALTALSDEEVIYKEEHGKFYYLRYYIDGDAEGRYAVVATTRPETIMGDTAMCINPNDPKTQWLKGKKVIVPLVNRVIPVIEDEYVDMEFGTGCLKVTPAHDVNDYMLGEKHNLPSIDIFNDNGTLSEAAGLYVGMDRFDVRRQIEKDLDAAGLLEKVEAYTNKVGFSERTNVPIEPKLSMQWFLKMQHFADMALPPVMNDELKFYPAKYKNTYRNWLENIKDWCISRQLWWGHRIPAWYYPIEIKINSPYSSFTTPFGFVVAEDEEKAKNKIKKIYAEKGYDEHEISFALKNYVHQERDCLDTWFSSWLWPISLFDGINNPGNEEIKYYYPTSDLVTAPDIIFFWVARMIMAGYEYMGDMPFRNVYFTGIVRDKLGRKMSKSLGNSPDPLELIDKFGADGVRMGMMLSAPAGNDILFDEALCEQGRNFCNKIWNAFRLIKGWEVSAEVAVPEASALAMQWFEAKQSAVAAEVADLFSKYRLSEALMAVYKLFWDEFSSWYLEMIKPAYGQPISKEVYDRTIGFFDNLLHLLHPFMPFITEELWQHIVDRQEGESLMVSPMGNVSQNFIVEPRLLLCEFEEVKDVIRNIREIYNKYNINWKNETNVLAIESSNNIKLYSSVVEKLTNVLLKEISVGSLLTDIVFLSYNHKYSISLGKSMVEEELERLKTELKRKERLLEVVLKKLGNPNFVEKAPQKVIELEQKKKYDAEKAIESLRENIERLEQK